MFRAKDILIKSNAGRGSLPDMTGVQFGQMFSPHMFEVDSIKNVWGRPRIHDFGNISIPPQCGALHYALQCFEGLKAYKDANGNARLFRPDMNMKRLQSSMQRLCFPRFDEAELVECLRTLIKIDKDFIPAQRGYSLYIRPTAIGTNENLRVGTSDQCKLYIITSPVGPYYPNGFKPISLLVHTKAKRAWPGGTGCYKLGANYAGPIYHQTQCPPGYPQILWLGPGDVVDEVGAMNFMVLWKTESGELELATAPLDGTILPGVTRDSILTLVREWGEVKVSERRFTIHDIKKALAEKRVVEMFGCGTAAIITQVDALLIDDVRYDVPTGELSLKVLDTLQKIQYGEVEHSWSCIVK
jgi:branched-chain amino acid aminotransferase